MSDLSTVTLRMGGIEATVDLRTLNGFEWRDIKRATGLHQYQVLAGNTAGDFDCQAALMWVAIRRDEPNVTYDEVLAAFSYASIGIGPEPEAAVDG